MTNQQTAQLNHREHCRHCVFRSPIFTMLKPEELDLVNTERHEVIYSPGETIFKQGSPLTHVLSFNYGLAKMQVEGKRDSRIILQLVKPVAFVSGMGLFTNNLNQFSLKAITRSSVCYIDKENFTKVLNQNKPFLEAFLKHLEDFHSAALKKMINLCQKNSAGRIAETLLYLSDGVHQNDGFDSFLTTQELADLAVVSRESAFKVLKEFCNQGIIDRDNSHFTIRNRNLLEKISRSG